MHASMERRVFEQTQANDEDLRSQLASVIKEERERKVGMCDALCVCVFLEVDAEMEAGVLSCVLE